MADDVATVDFTVDRQVWCIRTLVFFGLDFTGGDFVMQVRTEKDTTGSPLVSLTTVTSFVQGVRLLYAGTATITAHIAAGRLEEVPDAINPTTGVSYVAGDSVLISQIAIYINYTTLQGLPYDAERGGDPVFYYDLHAFTGSMIRDVLMRGKFIVRAGVTVS